ncbi:hypothetical protein IX39_19005 [Chryseobacterium formosense]|uniref:Rieske domain-containing protein n=1 Tax=Chryseobacterium formosense TaxID=236814 RepID=A0A085Z083_9FLAO|nr:MULTISPECIES: hypothetical protein [Chryseobacterium]KFE97846.1 hypothetical protein IX39_19005 [Chryseobacterium formosense]OCK51901.1 hypothetical protein BA768_15005 [Chryseobacterium sp. CBo1]SFT83061.1 hypothetical protein SAMN05421857_3521 [Chryseobacterium formosense]
MKKTFSITSIFILLTFSILNINSCSNRDDTVSCFPLTPISVNLNLNLAAYNNLNFVGGWIYVDEQQSGTRGLIVVRTADNPASFKVYDRNAPHICPENNTTLEVKDGISIICPKDNATWILLSGQPTTGSSLPPKTYFWNYDAATKNLSLYN